MTAQAAGIPMFPVRSAGYLDVLHAPSPEQPVQPIGAQRARPVDFASPRPRSPPAALGIERDGCDPGPRSRLPAESG